MRSWQCLFNRLGHLAGLHVFYHLFNKVTIEPVVFSTDIPLAIQKNYLDFTSDAKNIHLTDNVTK